MKKISLILFTFFYTLPVFANIDLGPVLNKVTLQLQAEQWVTTKTAVVNVSVNAAVSDQGIGNVQADVLNKLKQLSNKDEWHIASFNRQQDQSGLESIYISAQARLPQTELAGLRDKAKAISKPGEKFTIDQVSFVPSDEEFKQANMSLRNNLYQQAKAEIDTLNKFFPEQKYYLFSIDFNSQAVPPFQPMPMNAMVMGAAKMAPSVAAPPIPVGNKVQLQATVVIASIPDVVLQKFAQ